MILGKVRGRPGSLLQGPLLSVVIGSLDGTNPVLVVSDRHCWLHLGDPVAPRNFRTRALMNYVTFFGLLILGPCGAKRIRRSGHSNHRPPLYYPYMTMRYIFILRVFSGRLGDLVPGLWGSIPGPRRGSGGGLLGDSRRL